VARAGRVFSLLHIPVAAAQMPEFIETFAALEIFELASKENGMLSASLLQPTSGGDELLVIAEWPTADAYQGWLENPARAQVNERLGTLADGEMVGGTFVVAYAFE
jgi:heme-degrading monooxygenase HmoA